MKVNLGKNYFEFAQGYNVNLADGCKHQTKTCYSYMNRYSEQADIISNMMKNNQNGALKVFNVGIAEGQEPLTLVENAYNIVKGTDRSIANVLDLTMTDILKETPISQKAIEAAQPAATQYLKTLYRNPDKAHFATPFETIAHQMLLENKKQDVVLFNNVIQHMNFENPKSAYNSIEDLIKLVKKDGIFCFTCDVLRFEDIKEHFNAVVEMLKKANFQQIEKGIFKKIK